MRPMFTLRENQKFPSMGTKSPLSAAYHDQNLFCHEWPENQQTAVKFSCNCEKSAVGTHSDQQQLGLHVLSTNAPCQANDIGPLPKKKLHGQIGPFNSNIFWLTWSLICGRCAPVSLFPHTCNSPFNCAQNEYSMIFRRIFCWQKTRGL